MGDSESGAAPAPGTSWTALTTLSGPAEAQALGTALEALDPAPMGVGVFEIEDGAGRWEVGGYFDARPDEIALALLAAAHGARPFAVSEVPPTDWVAQVRRELVPVIAGRFVVHGAHDAQRVPKQLWPLRIEAAMAFGTGHHGTTRGCLEALDRLEKAGVRPRRIVDVGCGTGVLAMAAARLWPQAQVAAGDIDPVAVATARANLAENGLADVVTLYEGAGLAGAPDGLLPVDLACANILKGPLIALSAAFAGAVSESGRLVLSGLLQEQVAEVLDAYAAAGFGREIATQDGVWSTLVLRRVGATEPAG